MPLESLDLFCGCGGFGALASTGGHEIVLGIDNDEVALDCWGVNHPGSEKRCITLHPLAAIKWPDMIEHLHFSSPCQSFSCAKRGASGDEVRQGNALLRWSVQTALEFGGSWSLENVACARSKAILDELTVQYPDKIAYVVIDAADFGPISATLEAPRRLGAHRLSGGARVSLAALPKAVTI